MTYVSGAMNPRPGLGTIKLPPMLFMHPPNEPFREIRKAHVKGILGICLGWDDWQSVVDNYLLPHGRPGARSKHGNNLVGIDGINGKSLVHKLLLTRIDRLI